MPVLTCYASGDGALHFTWIEDGKSNGPAVTRADVERWLREDSEGQRFASRGYRIVCLDSVHPCIVGPCQRIDAKTLLVDGRQFTYAVDETNPFWQRDRHVQEHALTLRNETGDEVKHLSTRMLVCHFLSNETRLGNQ